MDITDYRNKILDILDNALNDLSSEDFDILIQTIQDYLDDLKSMLIKWENNMLDFEPKCSKETLENQVIFMQGYMAILRLRAKIEEIDLQFANH